MQEGQVGRAAGDAAEPLWQALVALRDDAVRILRSRTSGGEEAEDHVHEAMLRLAQRPIALTGAPQLRSLLVRTACCIAIDRHRRSGRQQRLLGRLAGGATHSSPEEIVADRSEARWLAEGMTALGDMEYGALLHAMEGRRPGEIARLLGVDYKAAENALGRARRKLRLRAASVVVGIGALLRRLRLEEHTATVTASVLVAALLFSHGAGGQPHTAPQPPHHVDLAPALLRPVAHHAGPRAAAPPAAHTSVAPGVATAPRVTTLSPAPQSPQSTTPGLPQTPPPPWEHSPGVQGEGKTGFTLPGGTPAAWVVSCVLRPEWCIGG